MNQLPIIMHECTNWFPSALACAIAFPLCQKAPALPILSSHDLFDVLSSNSLHLSLIVELYILLIRHDVFFIRQRCSLVVIQHVCVSLFDPVFAIVIHQLKWEVLHELKGNRYFAAQSRTATRRNTAAADSSNKVRTIPHNILHGALRYLQLFEPLSAHKHVVADVENCRFPPSIDAFKPTCSSFPQVGLNNLGNLVLFFDPVLHLNDAFVWKRVGLKIE